MTSYDSVKLQILTNIRAKSGISIFFTIFPIGINEETRRNSAPTLYSAANHNSSASMYASVVLHDFQFVLPRQHLPFLKRTGEVFPRAY